MASLCLSFAVITHQEIKTGACNFDSTRANFEKKIKSMMCKKNFKFCCTLFVGRDSVTGIATCYGLDSLEIKSWREARFSAPVQTGPGTHPGSYTMGTGSFLGVKCQG
jgi:hypothetical protein